MVDAQGLRRGSERLAGAEAAGRLGADCWARFAAFVPLVAWSALAGSSRTTRDAVVRAARGELYQGSELTLCLGQGLLEGFEGLACTAVRAVRLVADVERDLLPLQLRLPASATALALVGATWRLFSPPRSRPLFHQLTFLDLTGLARGRGEVLRACIDTDSIKSLRELRAGAAHSETAEVDASDTVIDHLPGLARATPRLEALDIGYSQSAFGLDFPDCEKLIRGCSGLRHLDFSMVMTWRNFDRALEIIAEYLPGLQSLAVHGLQISARAFLQFSTRCRASLENLQLRACEVDRAVFPAIFSLPALRRVDLSGTLLLFEQADLSGQPVGRWLDERGQGLLELVLGGVVLPHEEQEEADLLDWVASAGTWCRSRCPQAEPCIVALTAVSVPRVGGWAVPLTSFQWPEHWFRTPRLFERVRPTLERLRRIDAGDVHGPWAPPGTRRPPSPAGASPRLTSRSSALVPHTMAAEEDCLGHDVPEAIDNGVPARRCRLQ